MTVTDDDLVQRIRAEADMASRAGQSAVLHKIADDLAAAGARGFEPDERIRAWEEIAKHPFFRPAYEDGDVLLPAMLRLLDSAARAGKAECPEVVVICGSTRFRDEMAEANRDLTLGGAIVLAPGVFGHSGDAMTDEQKTALDALHFRKIDMADRVLVVAPGGYIGSSTSREIAYAKEAGKPVEVREEFTAARAGAAADREALARRLWEVDHPDGHTFEGGGSWVEVAYDLADAALAFLAARGDSPAPLVDREALIDLWRSTRPHADWETRAVEFGRAVLAVRGAAAPMVTVGQVAALRERITDPAWLRASVASQVEGILHSLDLRVTR